MQKFHARQPFLLFVCAQESAIALRSRRLMSLYSSVRKNVTMAGLGWRAVATASKLFLWEKLGCDIDNIVVIVSIYIVKHIILVLEMPDSSANGIEGFVRELRSLTHRFQTMSSLLHGENNIPVSWRTILATLEEGGAHTIPQLAMLRSVSRQQIQIVVRAIEREGLIETRPNAMHRTSRLIVLSENGKRRLVELRRKEEAALGELQLPFEVGKVEVLTQGLREIRAALDKVYSELTSSK